MTSVNASPDDFPWQSCASNPALIALVHPPTMVAKKPSFNLRSAAMDLREYTRLLYEHAAREQRELAQRVRSASAGGGAHLDAAFERRAAELETELARRDS